MNPVVGCRGRPAGIGDHGYSRDQRIGREDSDLTPRAGIGLDRGETGTTLAGVNPAAREMWRLASAAKFHPSISNPLNQPILRARGVKRGAGE